MASGQCAGFITDLLYHELYSGISYLIRLDARGEHREVFPELLNDIGQPQT